MARTLGSASAAVAYSDACLKRCRCAFWALLHLTIDTLEHCTRSASQPDLFTRGQVFKEVPVGISLGMAQFTLLNRDDLNRSFTYSDKITLIFKAVNPKFVIFGTIRLLPNSHLTQAGIVPCNITPNIKLKHGYSSLWSSQ